MSRPIIGIDPGKSGAVAVLFGDPAHDFAHPMPLAGNDIDWRLLASWLPSGAVAYLEQVSAMPGQGVTSMFSFGGAYHGLRAMLETRGTPYELVTPAVWQRAVLGRTRKGDTKAAAADYCKRRFPTMELRKSERAKKPHDGICDALCIARYGQMQELGAGRESA